METAVLAADQLIGRELKIPFGAAADGSVANLRERAFPIII
jgi:hypothetical protein